MLISWLLAYVMWLGLWDCINSSKMNACFDKLIGASDPEENRDRRL